MKALRKIIASVGYSLKGLRHAYRDDQSFRMEVQWGLPIYLVLAYFLFPFQAWEIIVFAFSYLLILTVELINTAFETMLDKLHPEQHEEIGKSKDIASAAVFLALIFAAIVVAVLFVLRMHNDIPATITNTFV
jgi:diacylglycerol kinase (ATP)